LLACGAEARQRIKIEPADGDMTPVVRAALEGAKDESITLVLSEGVYRFRPDYAYEKYCFITNHDNGLKKIVFPFEDFKSVEIEGNGAELIFHGQVLPFLFENCQKVTVSDLVIDWDIPFAFLGEVVAVNEVEGWRDIRPISKSWSVKNGRIAFPNVDGFSYSSLGSSLPFTADERRVTHGAWDMSSNPRHVEKRKGGVLRFHEKLKHYPPVGSWLNSKGPKGENRYAPAFHVKSSKNIHFEGVVVHHALGMGFLLERSEDAILRDCGVFLREGAQRAVSATADATHFCNCKGDILVENCRFENMLDDGTNVHGTYVVVDGIVDANTVRVGYGHFQQLGFEFAGPGDELWFVKRPSPDRTTVHVVEEMKRLNDRFVEIRLKGKLPKNIEKGDIFENKTWNPTFTMRGCEIRDHRARSIILKTPLKTVIEDNDFSSMMSAIQLRGETFFWYESGQVGDVLIRNNRFHYCAYSGVEHAILYVTPRLGREFDQTQFYDRNIRLIDNTIETFDNRIVWADRVDGLEIRGNTIKQMSGQKQLYPNAHMFDFINCRDVKIVGNTYEGSNDKIVNADEVSAATLKIKGNEGF